MSQIIYCTYHSPRWAELVEQGWVTMFVDGTTAAMWKQKP